MRREDNDTNRVWPSTSKTFDSAAIRFAIKRRQRNLEAALQRAEAAQDHSAKRHIEDLMSRPS